MLVPIKVQLKEPVDAIEYTGDNADAVIEMIGQYQVIHASGTLHITRNGQYLAVNKGDFIINMKGSPLVATQRYFRSNYVEVPDAIQESPTDTGVREVLPRGEGTTVVEGQSTPAS